MDREGGGVGGEMQENQWAEEDSSGLPNLVDMGFLHSRLQGFARCCCDPCVFPRLTGLTVWVAFNILCYLM